MSQTITIACFSGYGDTQTVAGTVVSRARAQLLHVDKDGSLLLGSWKAPPVVAFGSPTYMDRVFLQFEKFLSKGFGVKAFRQVALTAALMSLASTAFPQEGKDREQVRSELAMARRAGDLIVNGEIGLKENELYPHRFQRRMVEGKTRSQVRTELLEAQQRGDVLANGEAGLTLAQLNPARYGRGGSSAAGRSRNEVIAELYEARRNGDVLAGGESGLTLREQHPHLYRSRSQAAALWMGRSN